MLNGREKKCQECGHEFTCSHSADCWCSTILLSDIQKKELAGLYTDCLCEDCLRNFSIKRELSVDETE